ncbi:HNH endonuclease [Haloferax profundi]|uniref:HNH endonuclease n=1 Tax=Haloferax profundi TaxID=1544718 RepID=UPI0009E9C137|nr:HNH endonuclease [Haloferax profundi]
MAGGYPKDWNSRRRKVYQRDGYKCQNCGRKGGPYGDFELHAHHIVPKSQGGSHKKSNLKTLCKQCHDAAHGKGIAPSQKKKKRGFWSWLFGSSSKSSEQKQEYTPEDRDDDGYVRLGKSNGKGWAQKKVDKKINKRHGGCPECGEADLTVSWIGLKPGKKVKVVECESCKAFYEPIGENELHLISSPEELDPSSSALLEELKD